MHARARPIVVEDGVRIPAQLLELVERELEARIEAKTATRYRQRRRAAKVARRLAALPTALLQCDVVDEEPEPDEWAPRPTYVAPIIVDLPAAAIREVRSIASVPELPIEPAELVTSPLEEIVVVADAPDEPVEEIVVVAEEPVVERAPSPPRSRPRRRAREAPHHREPRPVVEVEAEIGPAPQPLDAGPVAEPPDESELVEQPEVGDLVPAAPRAWQPSNPVWRERVFNSAHTRRETVTWPRPANGDFRGR